MSEWISVEDRLPDSDRYVLVVIDFGTQVVPYHYGNGEWWWYLSGQCRSFENIQYWKEYPSPPKPTKLQWQSRTKHFPEWKDLSDEMYEQVKHLAKFEFRQIEK